MDVLRNTPPGLCPLIEVLFLFFVLPATFGDDIETLRQAIVEEAPPELLNFDLGNSDVSLFLTGSWKGTLSGNWGLSQGDTGWGVAPGDSPLLFAQEADLTLSLWLRERWFLEAGFLDDYDLNTYRAGYQGKEGEAVQYVGIGNTGLDYPRFPYSYLGGDSASSFGAYGRFGMDGWTFHSMIRYDAAAREERIFVGNRERTYTSLSPDQILRGRSFVLPDENISTAPVVYLEDRNGDIRDASGRRWRKARAGEYGISARYGLLELVAEPVGMAAVYYSGGYSLGAYNAGTGFLGEVQDYFDDTRSTIQLWTYAQPGGGPGEPAAIPIDGNQALVIYEPGTFSPFERRSRYYAPASNSAAAALVRVSTGESIPGFEALPVGDISLFVPLLPAPDIQRGIYEVLRLPAGKPRDPRERWPLINPGGQEDHYPEIYLPGGAKFNQDLILRFTNYGAAGAYTIGTDVVPGSVELYRGGFLDPNITYNAEDGRVRLQNPVGPSEVIRISYLKKSEKARLGSLAAGIGAVHNPGGPFSSTLGLGVRWNISGDSYSEEGTTSPGTVGLGARLDWNHKRLKAGLTLGLGFEQPDTTGLYRIAGMEGNSEIVLPLSSQGAFISEAPPIQSAGEIPAFPELTLHTRADLVYRSYRNTDILGSTSLMPIDWSGNTVIFGKNSPYPVFDPDYREVFTVEPEYPPAVPGGAEKTWTGFQVPLGSEGALLEQARQILVPFRFYGLPPGSGTVKVVVQLGALNNENTQGSENPDLIVEKVLFAPGDTPSGSWEKDRGIIYLTDTMRRKLQGARYMRIIIITNGTPFPGRVLIAKPVILGASWRPITLRDNEITTAPDTNSIGSISLAELSDPRLRAKYPDLINRLHPESARQQVLEIQWNELSGYGDAAGADGRAGVIPLSNYRVLSFFLKTPNLGGNPPAAADEFRFILGRGSGSLKRERELALDVAIPGSAFLVPGEWVKVEIHYRQGEQRLLLDGREITGARLTYHSGALPGTSVQSGAADWGQSAYMAAWFTRPGGVLPAGTFSMDELILEEPIAAYRANAGGALEWTFPGTLVSLGDNSVIGDLSLGTALETGARLDPFTPETGLLGAESRSTGQLTLLGTRITGNLTLSLTAGSAPDKAGTAETGAGNTPEAVSWGAGHDISRSWGPLSLTETFSDSPLDETLAHNFGLRLTGGIYSHAEGALRYGEEKLERRWDFSLGMEGASALPLGVSLDTTALWTEHNGETGLWLSNYANAWVRSWVPLVPDWGVLADKRELRTLFRTGLRTLPLGLEFSLEGESVNTRTNPADLSATRGRLDFPMSLGKYRLRLREERFYRWNLRYAGEDVRDDLSKYAESLADSLPLWYAIPLYALFDPPWGDTITRAMEASNSADLFDTGLFAEQFALTLMMPDRYGLYSMVLPREFDIGITRTLEKKLDIPLDMLSVKSSLGFSALNILGDFGALPLFRFYQSDEFRHTLTGTVNIPKNEDIIWRFQDEMAMGFFGFTGAELSLNNTLTIDTAYRLETLSLEWTVPAKKTLLGVLYDWYCGKVRNNRNWPALSRIAQMEYERLRRETLEVVIDSRDGFSGNATGTGPVSETLVSETLASVILGHESIIRIMGRLNFSAFGKLNYTQNYRTGLLSFTASAGTTLNISF
jgi:hypothetical protein